MKVKEYIELPIDEEVVEIGIHQARTQYVDRNLDDLARSIQKVGLLEPIVVARLDGGRYEIITGQRRYLACERLGWKTISAGVLDSRPSDKLAKGISLTENLVREDMTTRDYIAACNYLFREYGSVKIVSEELGISSQKVNQYVKYPQLVPSLKQRVDEGLDLDIALRAQRAATDDHGDVDEETANALADEMRQLSSTQQRQLEKIAAQQTGAAVEQIIEEGRRQPVIKRVVVNLSEELHDALEGYANDQDKGRDDAIVDLLESGLSSEGYMS